MDAGGFWAVTAGLAVFGVALVLFLSLRSARGRQRRAFDETRAYLKGVQYLLSDNPDAAIEELTRVVQVNTETIETYFALGALFRRKGEVERAIRIHQNIILRPGLPDPTRAQARFELALDYRRAGMLDQAKEALRRVVEDGPQDKRRYGAALAHLRDLHLEAGEWAEAVESQRARMKVAEGDERTILAHCLAGQGRALLGQKDFDGAKRVLKEALKIDGDCVDAHLAAAELAGAGGDVKTAQSHYDSAFERLPEAVVLAYPRLSDLFYQAGRYESLGDYLRTWVHRRPDVPHLRLALARHLRNRGLAERAVEELRQALELEPRFHDARQELGRILLEEDMGQELRREFEALLEAIAAQPAFECEGCGHESSSLLWHCPRCGAWDSVRRVAGEPLPTRPAPAEA